MMVRQSMDVPRWSWLQGAQVIVVACTLVSCLSACKGSFDARAAAQRVNALHALEDEENREVMQTPRMDVVIHNSHSKGLTAVALSPNEQYILSGSSDGTAKLWDVASGEVIRTYVGPYGNGLGPWEVGFSDDGTKVLLEDQAGTRAFDVNSGLLQGGSWILRSKQVDGQYADLYTVSPNGDFRVIEPKSKRNVWKRGPLIIWNAAGETIRTLETHNSPSTGSTGITNTLTFSRDGRHLAWADTDLMGSGMAKVWEVGSWRLVGTYPASVVNFSRDSRTMALGRPTGGAPYLRDLTSGEEIHLDSGRRPSGVTDLAMVGDGRSVVVGMHDGRAILWDLTTGQLVRTFECPKDQSVLSVTVSPTSPLVATVCADGSAWLWDLMTGKQLRNLAPSLSETFFRSSIRFGADGRTLALGVGEQVVLWDVVHGQEVRRVTPPREALPIWTQEISVDLTDKLHRIRSIALHPSGQLVAATTGLGVNLWDMKIGQLARRISDRPASALSFSPDGRVLHGRYDTQNYRWDVATGQEISTAGAPSPSKADPKSIESLIVHERIVFDRERNTLAVSADDRVSARGDGVVIKVSDLATNKDLRDLVGHTSEITALAFSPNGHMLVSGSSDGTIRVWDLQRGKEIAALISLGQNESVTITPDHYYRASKNPVKGVSFQVGDKLSPLEQFDQRLNKPDIVQQRLTDIISPPQK